MQFFSEQTFLAALKILDISPQKFADSQGISYVHLRRILNGISKNITIEQYVRTTTYQGYSQWKGSFTMIEEDLKHGWSQLDNLKHSEQLNILYKILPRVREQEHEVLKNMNDQQRAKYIIEQYESEISEHFLTNNQSAFFRTEI